MSEHPRGCADWHHTRRELVGRMADAIIPIPGEALDQGGAALAADARGITRRKALVGAGGLAVACSVLPKFGARGLFEAATAEAAADPNHRILVSIYLDGGNDGLNTFIPLGDPLYRTYRKRIGISEADALPVTGTPFGWHPALGGLQRLYDQGKVAVLPAVDYANPDLSHFNSQIFWRTGVAHATSDPTGWLGRTMDLIGNTENPLQAISMGWGLDPMLLSRKAPVATVFNPADFGFSIPDVWKTETVLAPYRGAVRGAKSPARRSAQRAYRGAIRVYDALGGLRAEGKNVPAPPVAYPSKGRLGEGLRNLARILGAGLGTRVATLSQGGYDTHDQQGTEHQELLTGLGDSLYAWQADLDARGLSDRVLTVVWSEFGRRVQDNESMGTDHGAGGLVLVIGNHANGGVQSEFPGLGRLDREGNLLVTTEFRHLYASLLEQWMGVPGGRIIRGVDGRRISLVR